MDQKTIEDLAKRYEVTAGAVKVLLEALGKGNGALAQFNHAELGGMGQWSSEGMTMIGDMFNTQLKDRVNAFTSELAVLLKQIPQGQFHNPAQKQSTGLLVWNRFGSSRSQRVTKRHAVHILFVYP